MPAHTPLSTPALLLLSDDLRLLFDQGHDTIATASLQTVCLAATSVDVPFEEREWHAHVLRRQLAAAYRSAGYVLLDGAYYTHGLLDVLNDLARGEALRCGEVRCHFCGEVTDARYAVHEAGQGWVCRPCVRENGDA